MTDRRGFFASIGAALLAPVLPLKEKWVFNRSHGFAYKNIAGTLIKTETWSNNILPERIHLSSPRIETMLSCHNYENGENDMYVPGLTTLSNEADPFQTFIVDTNEVI